MNKELKAIMERAIGEISFAFATRRDAELIKAVEGHFVSAWNAALDAGISKAQEEVRTGVRSPFLLDLKIQWPPVCECCGQKMP